MLPEATGKRKSKMAADKPEVIIFQLTNGKCLTFGQKRCCLAFWKRTI